MEKVFMKTKKTNNETSPKFRCLFLPNAFWILPVEGSQFYQSGMTESRREELR